MISQLSKSIRQYMLVTFNYWNFTVTDGALRMLVVLRKLNNQNGVFSCQADRR